MPEFGFAKLKANFLNTSEVRIVEGHLKIEGTAEQISGQIKLIKNGVIEPGGPGQVLRIYDGWIGGRGEVRGNLTLGYDPNDGPPPQANPVLEAGDPTLLGDFTVTESFHSFTSNSETIVRVGNNGDTSKLIVMGDYAVLLGHLSIIWTNTDPPPRQNHILVDIVGTRHGVFSNFVEDGRVENRGVRFKTTYLGGTGNDVALVPLREVKGRV